MGQHLPLQAIVLRTQCGAHRLRLPDDFVVVHGAPRITRVPTYEALLDGDRITAVHDRNALWRRSCRQITLWKPEIFWCLALENLACACCVSWPRPLRTKAACASRSCCVLWQPLLYPSPERSCSNCCGCWVLGYCPPTSSRTRLKNWPGTSVGSTRSSAA